MARGLDYMDATRSFSTPLDGPGVSLLDLPVAALAGLSLACAAFAIPNDLLNGLLAWSGLGPLFAAIGVDARIGLGGTGALALFGAVFLLLRWLDGLGGHRSEPRASERPRVRRRDAHPDAPPPAPLFAARELAEPDIAPPVPMRRSWLPEKPDPAAPMAAPPPEPSRAANLDELVARLEQRLGASREATDDSSAAAAPRARPEPAVDRLQSAIDSLQRLAAARG
jgi:hypothetical protein